jgi:hypothetical protein
MKVFPESLFFLKYSGALERAFPQRAREVAFLNWGRCDRLAVAA